jgi:hypothetical protein
MTATALECFFLLKGICAFFLQEIGKRAQLKDASYIHSFIEREQCDEKYPYSQCVLEIFNYLQSEEGIIPCPYHTDISMITCIPKCFLTPALNVWDWKVAIACTNDI